MLIKSLLLYCNSRNKKNSNKDISSFVIILRDESKLIEEQEAEKAKYKSEDFLYQILQRDIVNTLNQRET
jgi:hypothetical protein